MPSISSSEMSEETIQKFIQWGMASSEAMLDYPCHLFQVPQSDGLIAYRVEANTAIVFGDPICQSKDIPLLVEAFHHYCDRNRLDIIYMIVSESFAQGCGRKFCKTAMKVCEELIFNPSSFRKSKRLMYRINQAEKHGLVFEEYTIYDPVIENKILELGQHWRNARKGPQVHLGHLDFFEHRIGKRWFYLSKQDEVVGMALLSRLELKKGWLLKYLISKPIEIPFMSEFIMASLLETLGHEECQFLTYGVVPTSSFQVIQGLNTVTAFIAEITFQLVKKIFKLEQKKDYWLRYRPKEERTYVLLSKSHLDLNNIRAIIKVLKAD
ncbi:MAG: DUF2156 domain-containing protein [Parachlamydiaceae bacterium]